VALEKKYIIIIQLFQNMYKGIKVILI